MSVNSVTLTPGKLGGLKTRRASEDRSLPSVCIYGGPGTGKTTLAASAFDVPEMHPILHLNIENGTQSVKDIYPDLEILDIERFKQLQGVYNDLYSQQDADAQTCAGYKTIIIDNLTEGQKKGMEHIFQGEKMAATGISFTEFTMATFANGGWNISTEQMRKMIRAFRELPCYVIFVAWEIDIEKSDVRHLWTPNFTAKLASEMPGMINDCWRLHFNNQGVRVLQTARTKEVVAKDRTRKLPSFIENPTMPLIHNYWSGTLVKSPEDDTPKKTGNLTLKK
jgi:AAA domain-containing protein